MRGIYVHDIVVHVGDRNVVGQVLSTSKSAGGLHSPTNLDVWGTGRGPRFSNSGLVPVRWNADDGVAYEWWETPESLDVIRPALDRRHLAVH
jgi:hypothetical protein